MQTPAPVAAGKAWHGEGALPLPSPSIRISVVVAGPVLSCLCCRLKETTVSASITAILFAACAGFHFRSGNCGR